MIYSHPVNRGNTRTQSIALISMLLAAAGSAGCGGKRQAFTRADHAQPAAPATTTVAATAPAHKGTPLYVPAGKQRMTGFNPFWFEGSAEANWEARQGRTGTVSATLPASTAGHPTANPTVQPSFATAERNTPLADVMEGLTHVTGAAQGADFDPSISRDGRFLAFASTQHRETSDIYLKQVDGRTITQLTADPGHDVMPAFSPDGKRIAFASDRNGNWDIFLMSTSGGQAVQISSDGSDELHPSWSPDGSKLVFCRLGEVSGRWELWVTDTTGGSTTEFIGYGLFPEWCPVAGTGADGRDKILFQRSRERGDRAFSLWTVDYRPGDTSSPTEIASSRDSALINASWNPTGDRIVFASINQQNTGDGSTPSGTPASDLWIVGVDGTGKVALTGGQFMNLMPVWGQGGRIFFVSDRTGVSNIWSVGTDKAILAATGHAPTHSNNHGVANTPSDHTTPENKR